MLFASALVGAASGEACQRRLVAVVVVALTRKNTFSQTTCRVQRLSKSVEVVAAGILLLQQEVAELETHLFSDFSRLVAIGAGWLQAAEAVPTPAAAVVEEALVEMGHRHRVEAISDPVAIRNHKLAARGRSV